MTSPIVQDLSDPEIAELERLRTALVATEAAMGESVIGQADAVHLMLVGLIAGGHVLLEGPPGVGKTLMVRTLAQVTGLNFSRIQFTPDLMPADITGAMVLVPDVDGRNRLEFRKGPVFSQLVLADEINRATPRTQSALLEAMQEGTVSAAGKSMALPRPFFVLATQNPIEMEGTYALPEAQIDRFLIRIDIDYPEEDVLSSILDATTGSHVTTPRQTISPDDILKLQALVRSVPVAAPLRDAIARFCLLSQPGGKDANSAVQRYVQYGVSPRGAQSLVLASKAHSLLAGRNHVAIEDIRAVLLPVVRHRAQLNFEGRAEDVDLSGLMSKLFAQVTERL